MKKSIFFLVVALFIFSSCTKSDNNNENKKDKMFSSEQLIEHFIKPDNINDETSRIIDDITKPDYTVGIIDNPNYGRFSTTPEADIMISGKMPSDISLEIDGTKYKSTAGQWLKQSIEFKKYYGKMVNIKLIDSDSIYNFVRYIPIPILVKQLSPAQSQVINRENNVLEWQNDPNSISKKVALFYELYNNEDFGSNKGLYKRNILLLDDNGSFNMDLLIDNNCKRIFFRMISGNTTSIVVNGKKILFFIGTYDHHEYIVK